MTVLIFALTVYYAIAVFAFIAGYLYAFSGPWHFFRRKYIGTCLNCGHKVCQSK